ncbi:MAG: hypothetical protein K0Q53_1103 [Massilibacillus sp.]|nr:hypothetical protein [Massilibacillus sp.]
MLWEIWLLKRCFSVRFFNLQYKYLSWQLNQCMRQNKRRSKKVARLMRNIFFLTNLAIFRQDEIIAYKMVDLLKLAYGDGILRVDEPMRLMNLCIASMKEKQFATTGYILDAYKPLMRSAIGVNNKEALEQLIVLGNITKKIGKSYLVIKVTNCVFDGVRKIDIRQEENAIIALEALKSMGLIAIKSRDYALLKEAKNLIISLDFCDKNESNQKFVLLLTSWVYQIIKCDDLELFMVFRALCLESAGKEGLNQDIVTGFIEECMNFVGIVAANVRAKCGQELAKLLFELVANRTDNALLVALNVTGKIAKMAIELYGVQKGFSLLFPLLEQGRELLNYELKFVNYSSEFRQRYLFIMIKELILLLDLLAKKEKITATDFLMQINAVWLTYFKREKNKQSVNQFCQLVLQYLLSSRQSRVKHLCESGKELINDPLFTENEKKRLGFSS